MVSLENATTIRPADSGATGGRALTSRCANTAIADLILIGRNKFMVYPRNYSASKQPSKNDFPSALGALAMLVLVATQSSMAVADALPTGGVVTHGQATVSAVGFNAISGGSSMSIIQSTPNAVIGWTSFDIAQGNSVKFQVPTGGATLNQIAGPSSQINGNLSSNGALFLINPNGVLFGNAANVRVGSLVASSSKLDPNDFMKNQSILTADGAGKIANAGTITAGSGGQVILAGPGKIANTGTITAGSGGQVVLAGADGVDNNGVINVLGGSIQMVSADKFTLTIPTQNKFLDIQIDGAATGGDIKHNGSLNASSVTLNAKGLVASLGTIQATSIGNLTGSVGLSGSHVDIMGDIGAGGKIEIRGNGGDKYISQIKGAQLRAKTGIDIDVNTELSIIVSPLMSDAGIQLKSGSVMSVDSSVLQAYSGDIHLTANPGIDSYSPNKSAVRIDGSRLEAKAPKALISITGNNSSYQSPAKGVEITDSQLIGQTIKLEGQGKTGVHFQNAKLTADAIIVSGNNNFVGPLDAQDIGIMFMGTNTLSAKRELNMFGVGGGAGIRFNGNNTLSSQRTLVRGEAQNDLGISFSGKLNTQNTSDAAPANFISNGFIVTPPLTL
ncbi:two-partner secretion domain-containing protein [Pseudomonas sp. RT6P73]